MCEQQWSSNKVMYINPIKHMDSSPKNSIQSLKNKIEGTKGKKTACKDAHKKHTGAQSIRKEAG